MKLPINLIPNSDPPKFRWEQTVETPIGTEIVEQEGVVPIPLEGALIELIELAGRQAELIRCLEIQISSLNPVQPIVQTQRPQPRLAPIQPISPKKGK